MEQLVSGRVSDEIPQVRGANVSSNCIVLKALMSRQHLLTNKLSII